ncbi:MAG: hypothetical protein AB1813_06345 [Verrucomicrobiota bacterium]
MRTRVMLLISIGLNVALAAFLFFPRPRELPSDLVLLESVKSNREPRLVKTNVVVRRQNFSWSEIESPDYATYVSNLRSIGCPEQTVRDIIVADVNELFARRRFTEVVTAEQQWWKTEPDMDVTEAAMAKMQALELERQQLLTQLLGSHWDTSTTTTTTMPGSQTTLDGPVLGAMTPEKKRAIHEIEARAQKLQQEYVAEMTRLGQKPDPAKIAQMREQTRLEMGQLMSPAELEEYLLRYSSNAQNLRNELRGLDLSAEEFRTIFRIRDPLDRQAQIYYSGDDSVSIQRRAELEKQKEDALSQALGPERAQMYKYLQDPLFRQAQTTAEEIGVPPETVLPLYRVNQESELERQRIASDQSLSPEEQSARIQSVLLEQEQTLKKILGDEAYEQYRQARGKSP